MYLRISCAAEVMVLISHVGNAVQIAISAVLPCCTPVATRLGQHLSDLTHVDTTNMLGSITLETGEGKSHIVYYTYMYLPALSIALSTPTHCGLYGAHVLRA